MNEKVAQAGNQVKQAFAKVGESWKDQEPARKKKIIVAAVGLVAVALGLMLVLNMMRGRYTVLYESMSKEESVQALGILESVQVPARLNGDGQLEVQANRANQAMGQLAMHNIPSSMLDYSIFSNAGGLTTTQFEKQQYQIFQMQDRLQAIIRTYAGVEDAFVNLNIRDTSNRVWDSSSGLNTASVKVTLEPGSALTPGQVAGIRHLVGPAAGINPNDVSVIDSNGLVLAQTGADGTTGGTGEDQFLQRQGFEQMVENRMHEKTANILSLPFPDADDYRISITARLDYDAMVTESMEYKPLEGTDHGVVEADQYQAAMGLGQYVEGVAGEENNTDIPTYVDSNGDGEADMVDFARSREFLVSYIKQQIEKDGATLDEASIAVMIRGTVAADQRQTLRELIAAATNVPIDNISVQGIQSAVDTPEEIIDNNGIIGNIPPLFLYIAAAAVAALLLVLILLLVIRRKGKKKRLAAELAAQEADLAEQERIQQEIEERKRQLKDAAAGDESENAITNEVRDFARQNPEITANLLRTWLKEEN